MVTTWTGGTSKLVKTFSFWVTVEFSEFSLIFGVFTKFPDWKNENYFSMFSPMGALLLVSGELTIPS